MKYFLMLVVLFSTLCYAESDSVLAQKGTQLNTGYDVFKTSEGGELRVVQFDKPSIHHFFTFANNQIFMNSVVDKQKDLREVRFSHNQFELTPYTATADTPLQWTMPMIQAVQAKSHAALANTPMETRQSAILIEELSRSCGTIQVLGELNESKSDINQFVVKAAGIGEIKFRDHIEGVSCDDNTLVIGTVACDTEKGPCYQHLYGVQYKNDSLVPSDLALLNMLYGKVDSNGNVMSKTIDKQRAYVSVVVTRYLELQNRQLLYVVTHAKSSKDDDTYCNACISVLELHVLEYSDGSWDLIENPITREYNGILTQSYYVENIGPNELGLVIEDKKSRQGEGSFDFDIYHIKKDSMPLVLNHGHYFGFNPMCESKKRETAILNFHGKGQMYDLKIVQHHFNEIYDCESRKYVNEEYIYRFTQGEYKLIKTNEAAHNLGY